jgi:hypothetical protein
LSEKGNLEALLYQIQMMLLGKSRPGWVVPAGKDLVTINGRVTTLEALELVRQNFSYFDIKNRGFIFLFGSPNRSLVF